MKTRILWILWAMVPLAALALHMGPGQRLLARDEAALHLTAARAAVDAEDWDTAAKEFAQARALLPDTERAERTRLSISEAKAKIEAGQFIEGQSELETILGDLEANGQPEAGMTKEVRDQLATVGYYIGWVMRLEGAGPEEWKPETEQARQIFRMLGEDADKISDADATAFKENLEAVIKLEQMDLSELRALPPPKKCCCNCSGLCQQKRGQRLSQCKNPGKKPSDVRQQIKTDSAGQAADRGKGS